MYTFFKNNAPKGGRVKIAALFNIDGIMLDNYEIAPSMLVELGLVTETTEDGVSSAHCTTSIFNIMVSQMVDEPTEELVAVFSLLFYKEIGPFRYVPEYEQSVSNTALFNMVLSRLGEGVTVNPKVLTGVFGDDLGSAAAFLAKRPEFFSYEVSLKDTMTTLETLLTGTPLGFTALKGLLDDIGISEN